LGRPCGPGALRTQLEKTNLRLRRHSHISDTSSVATYRDLMERDANSLKPSLYGMLCGGSALLNDVCIRPAVICEEDSMGSDHHSILMDVPPSPSCGGRSALGLVPQLEAGALGRLGLDHNLRGWSVCWPPGRLGL
jgi:hypothetical protein